MRQVAGRVHSLMASSSLKFNAVGEWWDEYIACVTFKSLLNRILHSHSYDALKKHIYQLEKQQAGLRDSYHDLEANEHTSLMGSSHAGSPDSVFIPLLDRELEKICLFYSVEEQRLTDDVMALQEEVERQEESGPYAGHRYMDAEGDEDEEDDDDFEATSPIESRDRTRSPRRRRQQSLSLGSVGPSGEFLFYVLCYPFLRCMDGAALVCTCAYGGCVVCTSEWCALCVVHVCISMCQCLTTNCPELSGSIILCGLATIQQRTQLEPPVGLK